MMIEYIMRYIQVIGCRKNKKILIKVTIIPILLANDKTIISLSHKDQVVWPVYVTIGNFDAKIH